MKKRVLLLLTLALLLLAPAALGETRTAYVFNPVPTDRLHLRRAARQGSDSLGRFYNGTVVTVLGEENGFYQVSIGEGEGAAQGYMLATYISDTPVESAAYTALISAQGGESSAALYAQPDADTPAIGRVYDGAQCAIWGDIGENFFFVCVSGNLYGYVRAQDCIRIPSGIDLIYGEYQSASVYHPDGEGVHLRAAPGTNARSLGRLFTGEDARVYAQVDDWSLVRAGGLWGYMRSRYLHTDVWYDNTTPTATVTQDTPLYQKGDADAERLGTLLAGAKVNIAALTDTHAYICCDDEADFYGYVPLTALSLDEFALPIARRALGLCVVAIPGGDENALLPAYATCDTYYPFSRVNTDWVPAYASFLQGESLILISDLGEWAQVFDGYHISFVQSANLHMLKTGPFAHGRTSLQAGTYTADGGALSSGLYTYVVDAGKTGSLVIEGDGFTHTYTPQGPASYSFYLPEGARVTVGEGGVLTDFNTTQHESPFNEGYASGRYLAGINGLKDSFWIMPLEGAPESYIRVTTFEQDLAGEEGELIPVHAAGENGEPRQSLFTSSGCFVEFVGCVFGTNG